MNIQTLATLFAICFKLALCQENIIGESVYACKVLEDNSKNVVFSPLSINTAFGMLYAGANGETKHQIKRAMFNTLSNDQLLNAVTNLSDVFNARNEGYNITLANRLYAKSNFPLLESYTTTLRTKFSSDIVSVNEFTSATVNLINTWVAEKTNNKIKDLLKPNAVNAGTRLVLVNALYFKAHWDKKFEDRSTIDQLFYSQTAISGNVKMMQMFGVDLSYHANTNVQVLGLDFRFERNSPNLKMFFVLPKERYGLNYFLSGMENLNHLTALFRNVRRTYLTKVAIPKFKIEFELDLAETLPSTGIKDVFDEIKADLSAISGNKGLFVATAVHKAFIELGEDGVEAAAATVIVMAGGGRPYTGPKIEFIADHPFLFAIVDARSYTTLFFGKYIN